MNVMELFDKKFFRWFADIFDSDLLSPIIGWIREHYAEGTLGLLARRLIIAAVLMAVAAYLIDQAFYVFSEDQFPIFKERLDRLRNWIASKKGA